MAKNTQMSFNFMALKLIAFYGFCCKIGVKLVNELEPWKDQDLNALVGQTL